MAKLKMVDLKKARGHIRGHRHPLPKDSPNMTGVTMVLASPLRTTR